MTIILLTSLLLACVFITVTRQAIADDGYATGHTKDKYKMEKEYAFAAEEDHEECVEAWAEVNRRQDSGCLDPLDVKTYERKCKIPELRERIRDLQSRCHQKKPKQFLSISRRLEDHEHTRRVNNRSKRMVYADEHRLWPGGKVPFISAEHHNYRAMKTMERFTCIRFYPWSKTGDRTTNDELGLDHQSYVNFVYEGGCWADQGNKRHGMQKISCCGGTVCLHELSHALGAYHEQQNPLGKGRIRLNPYNTESDKAYNFRPIPQSELGDTVYSSGFDMTSLMGYPRGQFGNGKGSPIDFMFSDLYGGDDWYYILQEISHVHKCDELYCSDFKMKCVNDGYVTLVDNVCACMCPKGLDPRTGCKEPLKDYPEKWPIGTYGIPKTKDGCPDAFFKTGAVIHTGSAPAPCADENPRACKYWFGAYGCLANPGFMNSKCPSTCNICDTFGNHVSVPFALAGYTNNDQVEDDFCVKEDVSMDDPNFKWLGGQYCLYRKDGVCPEGLDVGSVTFHDEHHSNASNSVFGAGIDGEFTPTTTQFEFCCSKYGFIEDELILPRAKPFALLKSSDDSRCQNVRGMHFYEGYTVIKNKGGQPNITGDTPLIKYNEDRDEWKVPYCYYVPTNKNCGGVIDLTPGSPTATFDAQPGQEFLCSWIITGPANSRILLNFDQFNVTAKDDGKCIDKVRIKYDRIAQPGSEFCGDNFQKSISSVNNTMMVTYETFSDLPTHPGGGNSQFKATVSLIYDDNLCYTGKNKGHGYAGPVNRTRGMKPCLPWAEVAHCVHNPFTVKEMLHGLTDNFCRNPDLTDGFRPWCYTDAVQCYRDYCDVCGFENLFDHYKDCDILAKLGYCENDPHVLEQCAGTCKNNIPNFPKPQLANAVTCSAPGTVSDADIVGSTKASYSIGDVVTYKCKNPSQPTTKERTCLSTGKWTSLNYVCSECEPDWLFRDGNCYHLFHPLKNQPAAVADCKSMGAKLVTAKTKADMEFLASLSYWDGTWLDAHDKDTEGTWKWSDGTLFTWTNWANGQPDNYGNEDCLWMQASGYFEDRWCTADTYHYVCVKPQFAVSSCDDVTDDCANFYSNNVTVCVTQADFMKVNCKKTCGLCSPITCTVEAATSNAQKSLETDYRGVDQGEWIKYECKAGYRIVSGDSMRGCLANGRMSGKPLVCEPEYAVTSNSKMEKVSPWGEGGKKQIHTGNIPGLVIPADGKIVRWVFWSTDLGDGAFQVWRNATGEKDKLQFIGQNLVTTPNDWNTTYYVPEAEQITVKKGDYIGIWLGEQRAGIGYTKCDANDHPGTWTNLKRSKETYDDPAAFHASSTYDFEVEGSDVCRIYRWRAVIKP